MEQHPLGDRVIDSLDIACTLLRRQPQPQVSSARAAVSRRLYMLFCIGTKVADSQQAFGRVLDLSRSAPPLVHVQ